MLSTEKSVRFLGAIKSDMLPVRVLRAFFELSNLQGLSSS